MVERRMTPQTIPPRFRFMILSNQHNAVYTLEKQLKLTVRLSGNGLLMCRREIHRVDVQQRYRPGAL